MAGEVLGVEALLFGVGEALGAQVVEVGVGDAGGSAGAVPEVADPVVTADATVALTEEVELAVAVEVAGGLDGGAEIRGPGDEEPFAGFFLVDGDAVGGDVAFADFEHVADALGREVAEGHDGAQGGRGGGVDGAVFVVAEVAGAVWFFVAGDAGDGVGVDEAPADGEVEGEFEQGAQPVGPGGLVGVVVHDGGDVGGLYFADAEFEEDVFELVGAAEVLVEGGRLEAPGLGGGEGVVEEGGHAVAGGADEAGIGGHGLGKGGAEASPLVGAHEVVGVVLEVATGR